MAEGTPSLTINLHIRRCWIILAALLAGALLWAAAAPAAELSPHGNPYAAVTVKGVPVKAEVVRTPEKLFQCLGYRSNLPENEGMLFVLPDKEIQRFCMRGMQFALDFIWIDRGKVAGLERNVPPDDDRLITSPEPVRYVLEVPAGFADRHRVQVGDPVVIIP